MTKYRKKPVVIEATQVTDEWFDGPHPNPLHPVGLLIDPDARTVQIDTLEGTMVARVGDFIITGVQGERYPCKPDIFAATYDPVRECQLGATTHEDRRLLAAKEFAGATADTYFSQFKNQVIAGLKAAGRALDANEAAALDDALEACKSLHLEAVVASAAETFTAEELSSASTTDAGSREVQFQVAMCARMPAVTEAFGREFAQRMEALP